MDCFFMKTFEQECFYCDQLHKILQICNFLTKMLS
jgi:hypothetical protein